MNKLKPVIIASWMSDDNMGLYYYDDNQIVVHGDLGYSEIEYVVLHELGHMMGLDHRTNGIMQAKGFDNVNFMEGVNEILGKN